MTTTERPRTNGKAQRTPEAARADDRVSRALEKARATHEVQPASVPTGERVGTPAVVQSPPVTESNGAGGALSPWVAPAAGAFPSLRAALAAFQSTIPRIAKGQTATVRSDKGTFTYAYADLTDVTDAILPRLAAVGLSWSAIPTATDSGAFVLEYALEHDASDERKGGQYPLPDPGRSTPQAIGSAITYARRYTLCAVTGVAPGGDDDDAQSAQAQARQQSAPAAPPVTPPPAAGLSDADAHSLASSLAGELTACAHQETFRALWHRVINGPVKARNVGDLIDQETRQVLQLPSDVDAECSLEQLARAVAGYVKAEGQSVVQGVYDLHEPAAPAQDGQQ